MLNALCSAIPARERIVTFASWAAATVHAMRLEATGRTPHEVVEVYDVGACLCGLPFDRRRVHRGVLRCPCAGVDAHRTFRCPDCGHVAFDPPHVGLDEPVGSTYFGG